MQVIQDVKPAFSGHADVQNDDIPLLAAYILERFLCGFRFPEGHPGNAFTKSLPESLRKTAWSSATRILITILSAARSSVEAESATS